MCLLELPSLDASWDASVEPSSESGPELVPLEDSSTGSLSSEQSALVPRLCLSLPHSVLDVDSMIDTEKVPASLSETSVSFGRETLMIFGFVGVGCDTPAIGNFI